MKKFSLTVRFAVLGLVALGLAQSGAHAQTVVVPSGNTSVEGNSNNGFPFNLIGFGLSSQRYQQVYDKSEFSSLSGPELITQILFRPDAGFGGAFSSTLPSVQIDLSTTGKAPDGLSATFADNVGANDTVVYHTGPLALSSAFTGPANGPKDFDILINLDTPFLYDPTAGNLLLDVRNFGGGGTTQFDAQESTDSVSRVFSLGGVNADSGNLNTSGLVTKFQFQPNHFEPVPEPCSLALLATGGMPLLGLLRRRRIG